MAGVLTGPAVTAEADTGAAGNMRVLIAHGEYRARGGEERHVELLEEGLRAAGADVAVYRRGPVAESLGAKLRLGAGLAYRPSAGRELARELDRRPADVVHFHNLVPLLTPAALRAAKRSGAAVVWTVHNYRFACPAGTLLRNGVSHDDCIEGSSLACGLRNARGSLTESAVYGGALEIQRRLRLLERWVDAYVAPSAFVARMLVRAGYPGERIHVIHHGVRLTAPVNGVRAHALYAGRLTPEKGVSTLLEAARGVAGMPLLLAGQGPLAAQVSTAPSAHVRYVGKVSPDGVTELLRGAAFSVVPSTSSDNLPFAAIEPLAAGVPVVASRVGGLPEIVQQRVNGLLVPPGDPAALADAMRTLWHDVDLRSRLARGARRIAAERFSLEGQTRQLLDLYGRLRSTP
jgi:glycosyltransferase involved in cell wall biosynthesis